MPSFFDDVLASESHRIANENDGWKVAKRLLEFERTMMADLGSEGAVDIEPSKLIKITMEQARQDNSSCIKKSLNMKCEII